ncbi:MAG: hypothetical protein CL523_02545 [Actinomycetales bacterium]|nr:MAG: hypothetical protein CL523_02545 [Actinomycetales bacterium]
MKRPRKSLIAGVGVLIFTVILAGVAVTAHTNNEAQPEWLMVMNAETGEFQKDTTGEDYTLSLTGLSAGTLAFTDRPERQAQTWDTAAFLGAWASEFGDDPPNAVVSADGVRVAVTLSNPQAIGGTFTEIVQDSGPITGAVTFTATPLPGQEPPTSLMNQPTLFIDELSDPRVWHTRARSDGDPLSPDMPLTRGT